MPARTISILAFVSAVMLWVIHATERRPAPDALRALAAAAPATDAARRTPHAGRAPAARHGAIESGPTLQ